MTVFRYMSLKEFELFQKGEILVNKTDHSKGHKTSSKGFCFFNENDFSPSYAFEFLEDIVSDDVCVRFEVDEKLLVKSWGVYADPYYENWSDTITVDEWCCESYNNRDFKLLDFKYMKTEKEEKLNV